MFDKEKLGPMTMMMIMEQGKQEVGEEYSKKDSLNKSRELDCGGMVWGTTNVLVHME